MVLAFNLFSTSSKTLSLHFPLPLTCGDSLDTGDRKTSTSAEPTDCPSKKDSDHTNSVQTRPPLLESNRQTTPARGGPSARIESGDPRKVVKRIKPPRGAKPDHEQLVGKRKIIESVKRRFSHLTAALGVGKRVCRLTSFRKDPY